MDRPEQERERAQSSRSSGEQAAGAVRGGATGAAGVPGGKGRCVAEKSVNGMYEWRLKAPNGRVVAVSPAHFRTAEEAVRACAELRDGGAEQLARITHENEGIGWVWSVPGPYGRPLARSPRAYERYATCQNAFRKFMLLLVGPGVPPEPAALPGPSAPSVPPEPSVIPAPSVPPAAAGRDEAEPSHERRSHSLPDPGPGERPALRSRPPAGDESAFRCRT